MSDVLYQLYWRGKNSGHFSLQQIKKMLNTGEISPIYQISVDGKTWLNIHNHPDFKTVEVNNKPESKQPEDEKKETLSSATVTTGNTEKNWLVKRNGETAGPFPSSKMEFFAGRGLLFSSDLICIKGSNEWQNAGKYFKTKNIPGANPSFEVKKLETIYDIPDEQLSSLHFLIPIKKMMTISILKNNIIKMFFFFGLAPMVIMGEAISSSDYSSYFWGIYFCMAWAGTFALLLKPQKQVWKTGIWIALFTMVIGIGVLLLVQQLPFISSFYALVNGRSKIDPPLMERLIGFIFGVGVCEEFIKILPILIFVRGKNYSIKEYMFIGMLSGFGFAIAEGVTYTQMYSSATYAALSKAESNNQVVGIYSEFISLQLLRYITLPILHAAWCGIVAWFAATSEIRKKNSLIIIGIIFAATLHGLYNTLSSYPLFRILPVAVSFMFLCGYFSYGQDNKDSNASNTN